jgi:hypothetical protein
MATFAVVFTVFERHIRLPSAVVIGRVSCLPSGNGAVVLDTAAVVLCASETHKLVERDVWCRYFNVLSQ